MLHCPHLQWGWEWCPRFIIATIMLFIGQGNSTLHLFILAALTQKNTYVHQGTYYRQLILDTVMLLFVLNRNMEWQVLAYFKRHTMYHYSLVLNKDYLARTLHYMLIYELWAYSATWYYANELCSWLYTT